MAAGPLTESRLERLIQVPTGATGEHREAVGLREDQTLAMNSETG